jgi:PAS domain S-box-containing protein
MNKNKTKAEIQSELEQARKRIAELESAAGSKRFDGDTFGAGERGKMEARAKELLEAMPDAMVIADAGGKILMANAQMENLFGYVQSELVGAAVEDFLPLPMRNGHVENRARFMEQPRIVTTGIERDIFAQRKNGEKFPVEISLSQHKITDGEAVVLCAIRDVTERWRAKELITAQRDLARLISDGNVDEHPCEFCLQLALQVSKMDSGGVYLFDESSRSFELVHHQGLGAEFVKAVERFGGDTPSTRLILSGRTVYFTEADLREIEYQRIEGLRSLTVIPIQHHGQVLGCLNIASHTLPGVPGWARSTLETLAVEIGNVIIHRRTEESLKASRAQLRQALVAARMGTWRYRIPTARIEWSPEIAQLLGIDASQTDLRAMLKRFHPDDRGRLLRSIREALAQKKILGLEYRLFDAGGNIHWVINYGHVECDADGNPLTVVGLMQDITERKQMENALEAEAVRRRILFEEAPDGILIIDPQTAGIMEFNTTAHTQLGYTREEFAKLHIQDVEARETIEETRTHVHEVLQNGRAEFETLQRTKQGEIRNIHVTAQVVEILGEQVYYCVWRDITEHKQAEEAVRVALTKYETLFENFPLGITVSDEAGKVLETNTIAERLLGISKPEHSRRQIDSTEWNIIRPDGTPMPSEEYASVRALKEGRKVENVEMGIVKPDASVTWINVTAAPLPLEGFGVAVTYGDITERKQAEQALRFSEVKWRTLFETCPAGIALANAQGEFLDANPAYLAQLGYTRDELAKIRYQDYTPPKWHEQEAQNVLQLKASGLPMYFEKEHIRKDGTVFPVALTGWVIRDERGTPDTLGVFVQDITSIKKAELELRESEERHRLISEMNSDYVYCGKAFPDGSSQTAWVSGAFERITGYSFDEIVQRPGGFSGLIFPEDLKKVIDQQPVLFESGMATAEYRIMRKDGEARWLRDNMKLIEGDGYGKPAHLLGAVNDITAQKLAEIALRESESRYRLLVETSIEGIWSMDREHRTTYVNQSMADMLGYEPSEMLGRKVEEFFFPEDMNFHQTRMEKRHSGQDEVYERRFRRRDGSQLWTRVSARVQKDSQGNFNGSFAMFTDITERKQAEEALNKSQALLTEAQRIGHTGYMEWNVGNQILTCSEEIYSILGLPRETIITQESVAAMMPEEERDRIRLLDTQAIQQRKDMDYEYRLCRKDGGERWLHQISKITYDGNGAPIRMMGTIQDVTESKRAEEALRESERKLSTLLSNLIGFAYRCLNDRNWSMTFISNGCTAITGYSPEDLIGNQALTYNDLIHPSDREMVWETIQNAVNAQAPFQIEYRIITRAGIEKWVWEQGRGIFEKGELKALEGFITDITDRKRAEQALRESEERFRTVADFTYDLEYWLDENQRLVYISPSCERLTGYGRDEFMQNPALFGEIVHPDDRLLYDRHHAEEFHRLDADSLDFRIITADGRERWVNHTCQSVHNRGGKPRGRRVSVRNITERIKSEEKIRQQMEDLAFVNTLNEAANRGESLERILEILRAEGRRIFGCRDVAVYLSSPDQQTIFMQQGSLTEPLKSSVEKLIGRPIPKLQIPVQPGGFFHKIIHSEQGMITSDPKTLQAWMAEFAETPFLPELARPGIKALIPQIYKLIGIRSIITIPLKLGNSILGALEISSAEMLSEQELERLQNIRASLTEILKRKQVEQKLTESEEKYRGLMESLDNSVSTVDFNGQFTFMNDMAAEKLGGTPQELIGRTISELLPEPFASLQLAGIRNIFNVDQKTFFETQSMGEDGVRWYRFALQPLHDESGQVAQVLINATDIHDLKTAQQELQELNRTLEEKVAQRTAEVHDLYDNAPTGYHSLDAGGNFVMVNQTELNWLGYTREEIIGRAARDFLTEESKNTFRRNFPIFLQRGWLKDLELEFIRKDGSILPVSLNATAVCDKKGNLVMSRSTLFDITERKEAERTLRESEETYRALFENSNDAIFLMSAVNNAFVKVNPRCTDLLGYSAAELIGKNSSEFVDPLEMEDSQDRWKRLFAGEPLPVYERRLVRRGGEIVETDINLSLIHDASGNPILVQSVVRDITARKQAERALRESEEQNRLLFEESPVPIALLDETGHIVHANRAYEQLTGIPRSVLYGKTSEEMGLVDAQVINSLTEAMLEAMSRQENFAILEHELTSADGTRKVVESHIFLLRINAVSHILVTSNDISTHKKAEETLRRANVELERAMRMKDEFLATMSHELRTPLTGILGLSEALQLETYGKLSDKQSKTVRNIENSGRHLLALINDVLDLSKIEAGKLNLDMGYCYLEDICRASLQLTKGMAHQKHQDIKYSAMVEPVFLDADARRIKQVLVNLLSNSIKFTPENGELGLGVEPDKEKQQVRLVVWDKGIGIKPENLSKLFQPFTQIDGSLAREYSGTGLGLALVRRLVELHNGTVEVESVFGEGSRFIVTLPWTPQAARRNLTHAGDHDESQPDTDDENISSPMILIADDNQVLLDMMGDFLEAKKYRTTRVKSGKELLEKVESVKADVILMDIQMPGMDGLETIHHVRSHRNAVIAATPIIAVTALAMPGDRDLCLDAGANDYLSKPVKLRELVETLNQLTGGCK